MRSIRDLILTATLAALFAAPAALVAGPPPDGLAGAARAVEAGELEAAAKAVAAFEGEDTTGWLDYLNGRVALGADDYAAAIDALARAAERDAGSALFRRWLGEAYLVKTQRVNALAKMGPASKARETLAAAVELDPSYYEARESLVDYYLNAPAIAGGGVDKALAQAAEMAEISATEGSLLRARIHAHEEEYDQAAAAYREAAESRPGDARLRFRLGMAEQQREEWAAAFAAFEKAIELEPGYTAPYYQLGRTAVFAKQNLDRAVECMNRYLESPVAAGSPGHEHAQWRLGMLQELRGAKAEARAAYEAALAIDPGHEEAKKALARLGG